MKSNTIKYFLVVSLFASMGMAGCLKDEDYDDGSIQSTHGGNAKVIGIQLDATSALNFAFYSLGVKSDKDSIYSLVPVVLGTSSPAPEDIKVTVALDPSLVDAYNVHDTDNITHLVQPTSNFEVLNGGVVTIPKGSKVGYLQMKMKSADFFTGSWGFGVKITAIDKPGYVISGNLNKGVVGIGVNNKWDGVYTMKGATIRAGDPDKTGAFEPKNYELQTAGENIVQFGKLQIWADGTDVGIDFPVLTIDESTTPNPVTIASAGGAENAPGYNSRYDPATKTFYISFTWGAGPTSRLATDTLTFVGPR